jgi:hypothetical protein
MSIKYELGAKSSLVCDQHADTSFEEQRNGKEMIVIRHENSRRL